MTHFDLGRHSRPIRSASPEAQRWFDLGLNWCFGFNQEEGVACFRQALAHDPDCAMAHWGVAYGTGPFYNLAWREFGEGEARTVTATASEHVGRALALSEGRHDVERHLIEALAHRFQAPHPVAPDVYDRWDDDYAAAMRRVHFRHPDDQDVTALFLEALITRTPRRLWDVRTGLPGRNADALEALALCEGAFARSDAAGELPHPAVAHLHIHLMEMSGEPERALRSADALVGRLPDAGHMNHMPGHIYVLCGDYERAKTASEAAIRADDLYADHAGSMNFYVTARCHDLHLMMFTCMFLGQFGPALAAADKIQSILTQDILRMEGRPKLTTMVEGYYSMRVHVLVRFGRWHDIIAAPIPQDGDLYVATIPMHHYARGIAFATLKEFASADRERALFMDSVARVPSGRRYLNNFARDTLAVGEAMLEGEVAYHKGDYDQAFAHLREAVRRDDALNYTEPWAWMHPPRHALAALLLEQGHAVEAEQVYRDDLGLSGRVQRCTQHPDNVWSLHGLVECLRGRGEAAERTALEAKLASALARTDVPITSSCLCRTTTASRANVTRSTCTC